MGTPDWNAISGCRAAGAVRRDGAGGPPPRRSPACPPWARIPSKRVSRVGACPRWASATTTTIPAYRTTPATPVETLQARQLSGRQAKPRKCRPETPRNPGSWAETAAVTLTAHERQEVSLGGLPNLVCVLKGLRSRPFAPTNRPRGANPRCAYPRHTYPRRAPIAGPGAHRAGSDIHSVIVCGAVPSGGAVQVRKSLRIGRTMISEMGPP